MQDVQSLGWEDPPGEGDGHPLQYSCLENPKDRGAWWATGHDWVAITFQWGSQEKPLWLRWHLIGHPREMRAQTLLPGWQRCFLYIKMQVRPPINRKMYVQKHTGETAPEERLEYRYQEGRMPWVTMTSMSVLQGYGCVSFSSSATHNILRIWKHLLKYWNTRCLCDIVVFLKYKIQGIKSH